MAKIRKANRILTVKDDQVSRYVDMGYDVISDGGRVLTEALPTDVAALQRAYAAHKARIAELEAEVESLRTPKNNGESTTDETPAKSRRRKLADGEQ